MCHFWVQFWFQLSNHFQLIDQEIAEQNSTKNKTQIKHSEKKARLPVALDRILMTL